MPTGSTASPAFTCFAPYTCTIELPVVNSAGSRRAFELIWDELDRRGIAFTFHWGQCMRPSFDRLQQIHGERLTQWLEVRRQILTTDKERQMFANDMLKQWGLDA